LNVRVVRVLIQWIDQEDHGVDFALDYPAGDLHVTAVWTWSNALDLQADLIPQQVSSGPGGDQLICTEA